MSEQLETRLWLMAFWGCAILAVLAISYSIQSDKATTAQRIKECLDRGGIVRTNRHGDFDGCHFGKTDWLK